MEINCEFSNSKKLPIHEVILNHENEKLNALSPKWLEKRSFSKYIPMKFKSGKIFDSFDEDEWMAENKSFNNDLEWMLSLKFHRFWSHVIYDKEFLNPLLYFLQESTPFYIPLRYIFFDSEQVVDLYEKICRNALVVVCRLITNRESDEEFMTKEKQAELIYGNYVISVPMIFDVIALYGYNNRDLVQKILTTVLKIEPKYSNDLKSGIKLIQDSLKTIKEQVSLIETENRNLYDSYEDVSLYLMNIASTLNILIDLLPNDIKSFCSHDLHLEQSIVSFYDNIVPVLYQNSYDVDSSAWFLDFINYSRIELIHTFRNLLNRNILAIFNASEKNRLKIADEILSKFTECAGYSIFIADYVKFYPIEMDLDVLDQSVKKLDQVKREFVRDAYKSNSSDSILTNGFHIQSSNKAIGDDEDDFELEGACALPLKKEGPQLPEKDTEDYIQLETTKILELFPDYGAGYIRRLLAFYDNNSENVIARMLEDTLDESLSKYDKQEPYIPPETPEKAPSLPASSSTTERYVEEFGGHVLKNGKCLTKKQPKSYADLIDDKSHVNELRDRYKQYNLISDTIDDKDNEYDDEYDDSYDVFADTEPKIQRNGKMRDVLPDDIDSESSESESDDVQPKTQKNALDFCENPEIIRARREQKFQSKMAKKHPNKQPEIKTRDVVGNAKGQGQSNEVTRNRQQKNVNKSSRANHNRKAGSTFKQSRGMY